MALLLSWPLAGHAAEWFVKPGTGPGDGSAERPFTTVAAALKAARAGDTVTLRGGTYRENVQFAVSGSEQAPTVLRGAPGERAILSGFAAVTDWQPAGDGLYTAMLDFEPHDLFVGLRPQPVSWWPAADAPMRYVSAPEMVDRDPLPAGGALAKVAAAPGSLMAFCFHATANTYTTIPLSGLNLAQRLLVPGNGARPLPARTEGHRYRLANHPALISGPGQWAFEKLEQNKYKLTFRPARAEDLGAAQVRRAGPPLAIGTWNRRTTNVRVENLEVCGSSAVGLQVGGSDGVTLDRCIIHHNAANGIFVRQSSGVRISGCIALANDGTGIGIASSRHVVVEGNEVAYDLVDGLVVAGNISGRAGGEPETDDVLVRRNYLHHHFYMSHPDNMQTYRGVHHLRLEENLHLWGGQGLMTEETDDASVKGCVIVGSDANAVILGHGNSNRWTIENSTVGLGGWGAFLISGADHTFSGNILFGNPLSLEKSVTSDYNLFFPRDDASPIAQTGSPKWQRFTDPAQAAAATGQEQHSRRGDPKFRSAPAFQVVSSWADGNRADRLYVVWDKRNEAGRFAVGDTVEVNGDGVARRVKAIDGEYLLIDPALPGRPFRDSMIWNWKTATSIKLDLRPADDSIAAKMGPQGGPVGAAIDVSAYQRGDFDGDGRRDLPELPADLAESLPNANGVVIPLFGS